MIELGPGATLFRTAGWLIWLLVICVLLAAWGLPKTKRGKAVAVATTLGALLMFPGRQILEMRQQESSARTKVADAERRFQERCKTAGEFIYSSVENVEGVLVMKERAKEYNHGEQFRMDDPYGFDVSGDGYIENFLKRRNEKGSLVHDGVKRGYRYVDVINPTDGKRYRYTGRVDQPFLRDQNYAKWVQEYVLDKVLSIEPAPRYGVTYDDISTREDREYWIAGSSLRVIDLLTNEVMAERIGYMMDPGQGATGQGGAILAGKGLADTLAPYFQKHRMATHSLATNPEISSKKLLNRFRKNNHGSTLRCRIFQIRQPNAVHDALSLEAELSSKGAACIKCQRHGNENDCF